MSRLAIVSTYNENCGNASYTHVLKNAFSEFVEVDVIPLDLFLLQKKEDAFRKAADEHIGRIARKLKEYDYVNIQFEAGLFGKRLEDVQRRVTTLIRAAPNLVLTMHRIDVETFPRGRAFGQSLKSLSVGPLKRRLGSQRFVRLYRSIVEEVGRESKRKNAWIKVHTKRERRVVTDIYNMPNCFDYPLAFLTPAERDAAWAQSNAAEFKEKNGFAPSDKIVGLFGYISEYKGIETALQSLLELPPEYKLVIFGSHHPQSIQAHSPIHPFIEKLIELMGEIDDEVYARDMRQARLRRQSLPLLQVGTADQPVALPDPVPPRMPLSERVRFIGSIPDPEFIEALRLSDAVVLPYIEVGQSMSGVVVLGMEAGAKLICANNHSFAETRKYFGDTFIGFDIGNYIELAQKVQFAVARPELCVKRPERDDAFKRYNIRDSVVTQLAHFQHGFEKGRNV